MGFNFRKSINLGFGTKLNLSKSGLGVSTGIKGARIGVGSKGIRATGGIPGTGIYYTKNIGSKNKSIEKNEKNKSGIKLLSAILITVGILINEYSNIAFNIYLVFCLGIIYCLFQACIFGEENQLDPCEVVLEILASLLILGIMCYVVSRISFYIFLGMFVLNIILSIAMYKNNKNKNI